MAEGTHLEVKQTNWDFFQKARWLKYLKKIYAYKILSSTN